MVIGGANYLILAAHPNQFAASRRVFHALYRMPEYDAVSRMAAL
jgi:hypothetical protein